MEKSRTRRLLFLLVLLPAWLHAQLSLEAIFLNGSYNARTIGPFTYFNRQELYVQLKSSSVGQYLGVYDRIGRLTDSIGLNSMPYGDNLVPVRYTGVGISPDDACLLLKANEEKMFRRSGAANYFLFGPDKSIRPVSSGKISFPQFSADGSRLAYVKYNNLYWYDVRTGTEYALTADGEWNKIINGKSDWVYEEELELTQAFAWGPGSDKLAFLKFDESAVKDYPMPVYRGQTYPTFFTYKYPKVGEVNAKVSIWVHDLKKNKQVELKTDPYPHEYIPRIYWNPTGSEVWAMLLNRNQDTLRVVAFDPGSKKHRIVYEEFSETYIHLPIAFDILQDGSVILSSERDGYRHLYLLAADGQSMRLLTPGNFEVTKYYGVNETDSTVCFQSNEGAVAGRIVSRINFRSGHKETIAGKPGTQHADFAPGLQWGVLTHSTSASPGTIALFSVRDTFFRTLEDHAELRSRSALLPRKEFLKLPVGADTLEAWMIKPPLPDSSKRFPLLMFVYGGPGHQEVLDRWGTTQDRWFSYLAEQGYAVACVDNRGSGGQGAAFERSVFMQLGKQEIADQVAAARYFGRLPFIDSTRIGIYGSSYGGYLAALALLHGNSVFKAGIAQSPVTDWRLYDNVYTERYLRTPETNPDGYAQYCPVRDAGQLSGSLLLIHGLSDDNVHFQHSLELVRALNNAHKFYDLLFYPDTAHGISGGETRYDLYWRITRFLLERL